MQGDSLGQDIAEVHRANVISCWALGVELSGSQCSLSCVVLVLGGHWDMSSQHSLGGRQPLCAQPLPFISRFFQARSFSL